MDAQTAIIIAVIGGLLGAGSVGYLIVNTIINRRRLRAESDNAEHVAKETAAKAKKAIQEVETNTFSLKFDRLEDAAESVEQMFNMFKLARTQLAEATNELNSAHGLVKELRRDLDSKKELISFQQSELYKLANLLEEEKKAREALDARLKEVEREFRRFKLEHEDCLEFKKQGGTI